MAFPRSKGFDVVVGSCMDWRRYVSTTAAERAAELTAMLTDPEAIAAAAPTWLVGFSDLTTIMTALTVLTGIATLHGNNLMDTPYDVPAPLPASRTSRHTCSTLLARGPGSTGPAGSR